MKYGKLQSFLFGILIALIFILSIGFIFYGDAFSIDLVRNELRDFGVWSPIVFICLYAILVIFFPSTPFMALAGILFGFKFGFAYSLIGGIISSIFLFGVSRILGQRWADSILRNKYLTPLGKYNKRLERGAIIDLIIMRVLPVIPFNVLNIIMGISRIKLLPYIIGTVIGLIPSHIVAVYAGNLISLFF